MADPTTSTIRLTQPTVGGDSGTWGTILNSDLSYIDEAINQTIAIPVSDTAFTVTADGSSSDQARYLRYNVTGAWTANRTGTLPSNLKVGYVSNNTTGGFNLILTAGGTTNLTIPPDGEWYLFQVDGSNNVSQPPVWYPENIGRNLLHNGMFTVQQRGTGAFTSNAAYTADRWLLILTNDTDSVTIVTLADADRSAIGDERAAFALQNAFTGSATSNSISQIVQRIEDVKRLSNKIVVGQFWAKATSGTPAIGVSVLQNFGSGGSPSTSVRTSLGVTAALSSTWTRYVVYGTVPSASGKTFGSSAGTDYTSFELNLSDTSNTFGQSIGQQSGTVRIWGAEFIYGSLAAPRLEKRDPQIELALCQRFYQTGTFFVGAYSVSGAINLSQINFLTQMRVAASVALSSVSYSNASSATVAQFQTNGFVPQVTCSTTGAFSATGTFTATADL